jgi:hypothetical protein
VSDRAQADGGNPREAYRLRESRHERLRDDARAASLRASTLRATTFLSAAAALVIADMVDGRLASAWVGLAGILGVVFIFLVARHRRARRAADWHEVLRALAAESLLKLDRRWRDLAEADPGGGISPGGLPGAGHPYARDLDVEGPTSLTRIMGPVTTVFGQRTLRTWLMSPPSPAAARDRAEAVRILAPELDQRQILAAHGRVAGDQDEAALDVFLGWAEDEPWVMRHRWLRLVSIALPVALVATALLHVLGGIPLLWVLPAIPQALIIKKYLRRLSEDFRRVESMGSALAAYVPQLEAVDQWPSDGRTLSDLAARLRDEAESAYVRLARLARLVDTVESRRNMVYATLAPLLLLDVHLAARLDRWREVDGRLVRDWLQALGHMEALAAMASLAHDHPDWAFPTWVEDGEALVDGRALGHPLLPAADCVRNDATVGPPGTFLLVTGSNMSGKSTLLRAIGANVVLAGAGAPVCAADLSLAPVRVHTSMRIEDSLTEGVSLFMAELLRVRDIVEAAEREGPPVLYLLDEILHGTNTAERRIAARAVILHLVQNGAIGAVSTHDLTLAAAPDLTTHARSVHFREQVEREDGRTRLSFDYLLRPGTATTRNALRLLEAVGLTWDLQEED